MAQEDREAYIAWLRDEVGWNCNSRGCYEAFWDYDDSVTPDQIAEACANYEEAGFASPLNYLDESIMEKPGFIEALENELISAITHCPPTTTHSAVTASSREAPSVAGMARAMA